jgi:hypothetical protein
LYLSYFLYANGNYFPYSCSRYSFSNSLYDLFWWDDYLVLNWTNGYHPMAAIGRWIYGLGKCHGRDWSNNN